MSNTAFSLLKSERYNKQPSPYNYQIDIEKTIRLVKNMSAQQLKKSETNSERKKDKLQVDEMNDSERSELSNEIKKKKKTLIKRNIRLSNKSYNMNNASFSRNRFDTSAIQYHNNTMKQQDIDKLEYLRMLIKPKEKSQMQGALLSQFQSEQIKSVYKDNKSQKSSQNYNRNLKSSKQANNLTFSEYGYQQKMILDEALAIQNQSSLNANAQQQKIMDPPDFISIPLKDFKIPEKAEVKKQILSFNNFQPNLNFVYPQRKNNLSLKIHKRFMSIKNLQKQLLESEVNSSQNKKIIIPLTVQLDQIQDLKIISRKIDQSMTHRSRKINNNLEYLRAINTYSKNKICREFQQVQILNIENTQLSQSQDPSFQSSNNQTSKIRSRAQTATHNPRSRVNKSGFLDSRYTTAKQNNENEENGQDKDKDQLEQLSEFQLNAYVNVPKVDIQKTENSTFYRTADKSLINNQGRNNESVSANKSHNNQKPNSIRNELRDTKTSKLSRIHQQDKKPQSKISNSSGMMFYVSNQKRINNLKKSRQQQKLQNYSNPQEFYSLSMIDHQFMDKTNNQGIYGQPYNQTLSSISQANSVLSNSARKHKTSTKINQPGFISQSMPPDSYAKQLRKNYSKKQHQQKLNSNEVLRPIESFNITVINTDSADPILKNNAINQHLHHKGIHLKLDLSKNMKNAGTYFDDDIIKTSELNQNQTGTREELQEIMPQSIFDNIKITNKELNLEPIQQLELMIDSSAREEQFQLQQLTMRNQDQEETSQEFASQVRIIF
ncbi:UNKNOWN [Stylonychia lemnae]|uniref:Uncharacterized protein n=1 Tax=Stylonychia lemnae TaxID=5949 RepID=A0A078AR38_STYLE|nr:UNKNOWN [Stylonychia lemnae]|eukprot:CDW84431.1 UNKNOWN [Stylonychia lemnae]